MALEVSPATVCGRCGTAYGGRKNHFFVNYGTLCKGTGYLFVCKECVRSMFMDYLSQCNNTSLAMRQLCRKFDLYWSQKLFDSVEKKNIGADIASGYIHRLTNSSYVGKSYDDTLIAEGVMWSFPNADGTISPPSTLGSYKYNSNDTPEVSQETKSYWGLGFTDEQYAWLDQRRNYYETKWHGLFDGESGIGNDILIRQLCIQEVSTMQDMASGKSTAQGISALNNIIGSLNLKPSQKNDGGESALSKQPLGVLAKKIEERHPIKHNSERENAIVRYVLIWFYGHMAKSQGISNIYSKMYEDEMARLRVERPDLNGIEDDDEFLSAVFEPPQSVGDS